MKNHKTPNQSRREFIRNSILATGAISTISSIDSIAGILSPGAPLVSVVKIKDNDIAYAVEHAIDLLGGMKQVTNNKKKIMLKPNLVFDDANCTTKPMVIKTLARLMLKEGKEVVIGEGSAATSGINSDEKGIYFTKNIDKLEKLQQIVFDKLGYSHLARELGIPLINLHTGEMIDVEIPNAMAFKKITMHKSLNDIDLLCSVPMMKTHALATVSLGLKNLIGLYPGSAYCTVRSCVHDQAEQAGSPGIAYEILDMVKANKLGLTVIDGSMAMEGNGPANGQLVKMDLIIAGMNPLATDMIAAKIMGFDPIEVPTFIEAHKMGMLPQTLAEIEVRGEKIEDVSRRFARANVVPFRSIKDWYGAREV
jgi:uncharacterized protein (DUF362 family)